MITIGDHIRKRRLDLNLFQKDVAGILGVDTMTVNNWERNRSQPRLYLLPRIVEFLAYNPFPTSEKTSITEAIKDYRLNHGLNHKKMAKLLGIDPTTLARWENSRSKPGAKLRKRLAGLLGSSADAIQTSTPTFVGRDSQSQGS